jgi:hypothetical protein
MVREGVNWWRIAEDKDQFNFLLHQMWQLYAMGT